MSQRFGNCFVLILGLEWCGSLTHTVHAEYLFNWKEIIYYFYSSMICRFMSLHTPVIKISSLWCHCATPECCDDEIPICYLCVNAILLPSTIICYSVTVKIQQLTCSVTPRWEGPLDWSWSSGVANEFKRDGRVAASLKMKVDVLCSTKTAYYIRKWKIFWFKTKANTELKILLFNLVYINRHLFITKVLISWI